MPDAGTQYSIDYVKENNLPIKTGKRVTDDLSETYLGAATGNLQRGSTIELAGAAACSTVNRQGYLKRAREGGKTARSAGIFHQFPDEIQECLVRVSQKKAPEMRLKNQLDLEKQREHKMRTEMGIREKQIEKATKKLETAVRYHKMYCTEACLKEDPNAVDRLLESTISDTKKRDALKDNIKIRTFGFGWKKFAFTFSEGKKPKPLEVLGAHVKYMIDKEKEMEKPPLPHAEVNLMKAVPVLGTFTDERRTLDKKILQDENKLRDAAIKMSRERKSRDGKDSVYWFFQPADMPTVENMVKDKKRIDILWPMKDDDGKEVLQWCQGVVRSKDEDEDGEHWVIVAWDAMPDIPDWEEAMISEVELDPKKWKKNGKMGWRMDVDIERLDNFYDNNHLIVDDDVFDEDDLYIEEEVPDEDYESESDDEIDAMNELNESDSDDD